MAEMSFATTKPLEEDKPKVLVSDVPTVKVPEQANLPVISKLIPTAVKILVSILDGTPAF